MLSLHKLYLCFKILSPEYLILEQLIGQGQNQSRIIVYIAVSKRHTSFQKEDFLTSLIRYPFFAGILSKV